MVKFAVHKLLNRMVLLKRSRENLFELGLSRVALVRSICNRNIH